MGPSSSTRKRQTPGRCLGGRLSGGSRRPSVTNRSEHAFALRLLPRELPGPADRLGLLTRALFGRLLEMLPKLHFAEHAFALELLFQREGVFREMKLRQHFEKPSEKRARQKAEAIRRARKLARKKAQREGML